MGDADHKIIARNRRARFEYEILDSVEAGIALLGPEVKSLRDGKANLGDAYATIRRGEVWLHHLHISPYEPATLANPSNPRRDRKLLLHRREIAKLEGRVVERGLTLIPLSLYFKQGRVKVELGLARGKRVHDKRETIRRRQDDRETARALRGRRR
ncbi:MAG: SsrA-binding protein SmpB [Proteobacteria bacterium]|nr:SsrA-binding protein SmpB [Pseudomonadota bacterium]